MGKVSKLTYTTLLVIKLNERIERLEKMMEEASDGKILGVTEMDMSLLDAKRRGLKEALIIAKTLFTKMSRGTIKEEKP